MIVTSSNAADDDAYPVNDDDVEEDDDDIVEENESLSKMEPPVFQSPTMSAISPNQQLKDYFSEEDEKNAPTLP